MSASGSRPAGLLPEPAAGAADLAEGDGVGAGLGDRVAAVAEGGEVARPAGSTPSYSAASCWAVSMIRTACAVAPTRWACLAEQDPGGEPEVLGGLGQVLREVGGDLFGMHHPGGCRSVSRWAVSVMERVSTWLPQCSR